MAHSVPIDTREITVTPIFKHITVEDVPASEREGRAVMKTVEAVEVRFAGSKLYSPVFPVDAFWKRDGHKVVTYAERWADQYREFLAGRPQEAAGTPLEFLRPYGISDAQLSLCRALKIYSVEALHHLEGPNLKSLQMHANALKDMAARFMADRRGSADLADEVARLKAELAELKGAGIPADDPGPQEIEDALAVADAEASAGAQETLEMLSNEELKAWIKARSGVAPRGNPNRVTLLAMAGEIAAEQETKAA